MSKTNPAVIINYYLADALQVVLPEYFSDYKMAFIPTKPTDISVFYNNAYPSFPDSNIPLAVYERMFKLRRYVFPHRKCEQLLYYIYMVNGEDEGEQMAKLFETTQAIYDLMDRGDESAQEINSWQVSQLNSNGKYQPITNGTEFNPVFFHDMKVFQLEETRDIIDFATAETYFGNKIILDYDYHAQDFNNAEPFVVS